jgi:hypothetical protein
MDDSVRDARGLRAGGNIVIGGAVDRILDVVFDGSEMRDRGDVTSRRRIAAVVVVHERAADSNG